MKTSVILTLEYFYQCLEHMDWAKCTFCLETFENALRGIGDHGLWITFARIGRVIFALICPH